ncbi:histidine phosphatase family protein [Nocardia brevicatena]|uniref:histidine phosphatase family protein n=1 Tax=Nocardia brevicatena TaxID=37327 RepID=UPI00059322D3|nr:histidine phosphatase family protein [Nocardia brevicatena]
MVSVRKLDLISHGVTDALRAARFPVDEPLTEAGRAVVADQADDAAYDPSRPDTWMLAGPERRTMETAELLGLAPMPEPRLRDLDSGDWGGRDMSDLTPAEAHGWLTDPGYCAHGGESVLELLDRVRDLMGELAATAPPRTVAVTHPAVIRAALVVTLQATPAAFWRIDVPPGGRTRLHHRGLWTLRLN